MGTAVKIFGSLFLTVYLVLNYYIGLRTLTALRCFFPSLKAVIFWPVFLIIVCAYLAARLLGWNPPLVKTVGSYWLAAFFYLLLFYLVIDLAGLLFSFSKAWPYLEVYWQNKAIYLVGILLTAVILLIGTWFAHHPHIVHYDLQITKQPADLKSLKIVMISDLHIEPLANTKYLEDAAKAITALNPDLIMIAGDITEGALDAVTEDKLAAVIQGLQAKYGIYACLGNHEYYGGQADEITNYLLQQGVIVLSDEQTISVDGKVHITGRNDYGARHLNTGQRKPLREIISEVDPALPIILLDHQPQAISEAREAGIDLMLSGHTHGGQLFPADLVTRSLFIIDRGLWQKDDFSLIVSTGLGYWGPPVRTNSRSEIIEINITFAPSK